MTRLRFLTFDEEQKLLAAAKESLRTIILVAINAGLRMKSEALTLEWSDIDFHQNQLTVQAGHAKNGESRTIPLNSVLREALHRLKTNSDVEGQVFVSRKGDGFRTACRPKMIMSGWTKVEMSS